MSNPLQLLGETEFMAEREMSGSPRPKPGPRTSNGHRHRSNPRPAATARTSVHGVSKRRVGHQVPREKRRARQELPVRPPIDRARNRRWWIGVVVLSIVAFIIAIFEAPVFEVTRTQISGQARTNIGAIEAALAIPEDQALLTYDTDEAADRVRALPWVESASVVRQWPSSVRVVVRERAVAVGVGNPSGERWFLTGTDQLAIEQRPTPPAGVPLIVADDSIIEAVALGEEIAGIDRAFNLASDIPNQLDPWVSLWSIDETGVVTANLTGSAIAVFGAAGDTRTQFVSLASILQGGPLLTCIDVIDLSTADTPVIHRNPSCLTLSRELE